MPEEEKNKKRESNKQKYYNMIKEQKNLKRAYARDIADITE